MSNITDLLPSPSDADKTDRFASILEAMAAASLLGQDIANSNGLTWAYIGGQWPVSGAMAAVPNGTITLQPSTTNYVEADLKATAVANVVLVNQTGFTAGRIPLYEITTDGAGPIDGESLDERPWMSPWGMPWNGIAAINTTGGTVTLTQPQAAARVIQVTGALTSDLDLVFPLVQGQWVVDNQTSGAHTLSCHGATGAAIAVTQGGRAILYCDGVNFYDVVGNSTTGVAGISAADGTITIGGTPTNPTVAVGTIAVGQVTGAATDANVVHLAGTETVTGDKTFTGLAAVTNAPTADNHIANKAYVDAKVSGLALKLPALAMAAANVATLSGAPTVDGVSIPNGSRVLLTGQTTGSQNGLWITAAGAWSRPADFATGGNAASAFVFVQEGTAYADTGWVCATDPGSDVIDTNTLTWTQFSSAGTIAAGTGLTKTGNTLSVNYGTASGTAAQGNDSRIVGALQAANNLSDVGSAATARTNLAVPGLATSNTYTKAQGVTPNANATASGTVTPDLSQSNNFRYILTGNLTLANPSNPVDGFVYNWRLKQDSTGSRIITWPSKFKFAGGTAPVLSTAANAVDFLSAYYDATDDRYECSFNKGLA